MVYPSKSCDLLFILCPCRVAFPTLPPTGRIFLNFAIRVRWHHWKGLWLLTDVIYIRFSSPYFSPREHFLKFCWHPSCGVLLEEPVSVYLCYAPSVTLPPIWQHVGSFIKLAKPPHATYCLKDLWLLTHVMSLPLLFPRRGLFLKFSRNFSSDISLELPVTIMQFRVHSLYFSIHGKHFSRLSRDSTHVTYCWKDQWPLTHV